MKSCKPLFYTMSSGGLKFNDEKGDSLSYLRNGSQSSDLLSSILAHALISAFMSFSLKFDMFRAQSKIQDSATYFVVDAFFSLEGGTAECGIHYEASFFVGGAHLFRRWDLEPVNTCTNEKTLDVTFVSLFFDPELRNVGPKVCMCRSLNPRSRLLETRN